MFELALVIAGIGLAYVFYWKVLAPKDNTRYPDGNIGHIEDWEKKDE